jgi:hypothetical protein
VTASAKKTVGGSSERPEKDDAITGERRSRAPAPLSAKAPFSARLTRKMVAIDQRLLAIARGESDPEKQPSARPAAATQPAPPRHAAYVEAEAAQAVAAEGAAANAGAAHAAERAAPAQVGTFADYDPFGGLIPVEPAEPVESGEDEALVVEDFDKDWGFTDDSEPAPAQVSFATPAQVSSATSAHVPSLVSAAPREPLAWGAKLTPCLRPQELIALPIDPRSGFLLSHIDGQRTVEEVIDACNLSTADALHIIDQLLRLGAIKVL